MAKETPSDLGSMFQGAPARGEPARFGRIFKPDDAWLARAPAEPVLEPDLPIVDTHHHLWDFPRHRYLLDELLADIDCGHNIVATVFEECRSMYRARGPEAMKPVGEVEFVAGVAAMSDSGRYGPARLCRGIVGYADLALGERVAEVLEAEIAAGGGRFRGIRYSAGWDADPIIGNSHGVSGPGEYRRPEVRAGMKQLERLGLVLDAWLFHPQLGDAIELARAFPDASIVMCHMGGPLGYGPYAGRKDEVFADWKKSMTELATCPNVVVKLGGVMMRLAAYDYMMLPAPPSSEELAGHWGRYVRTCIDLFGPDRCMVESNFPVEKMGIGASALWNALKRLTAGASADEKTAIFSGTANRVYRLGL
ncbi:amidohydrolase family protein [Reyranella sp.]|uniref:amidohydrolase family protein n=1 Tax=Reyranella sp. TaxID=1929291 RepID=UPI003BACC0B4